MVVLLPQSCPTPVAISCRPTRTEGPQRSRLCGTARCRETMQRPVRRGFHQVADCKHSVGSDRQYASKCDPVRVMKHLRMLGIWLVWNGNAISELQWTSSDIPKRATFEEILQQMLWSR